MDQAANRLKLFTDYEKKYLLDRTANYVPRLRRVMLGKTRVLQGMAGWGYNLGLQLIFIRQLEVPWVDVDYKEVKPTIKACASTRNAVNGAFWRKIFIDICDDSNITEAVDDLGLAEPERSAWIKEEKAIF